MSTATIPNGIKNLCDPLPGAPKRYAPGRVCAYPGCTTILRRTNGGVFCSIHDQQDLTPQALELTVFGAKTCSVCGQVKPANHDYYNADPTNSDGLRCACRECKQAQNRANYAARRGAPRMTSPEPARDHIRELLQHGMPCTRIAEAAGCSFHTVYKISYGEVKSVRPATERKILAVEVAR
jgi:hypothetical protein